MRVHLHGLTIDLQTDDPAIEASWRLLFDYELANVPDALLPGAQVVFAAAVADVLPPPGYGQTCFADPSQGVQVYATEHGYALYLGEAHWAAIRLPAADGRGGRIDSVSLRGALGYGPFEDLTTMAMAPILRRLGLYLIHAFAAAATDDAAVLLVGESGSGKTTTGLALHAAGWRMLANDVAFLQQRPEGVAVLPSPGSVYVTPQTLELLPALRMHRVALPGEPAGYKVPLARLGLLQATGAGAATPVTDVYFPRLGSSAHTVVAPLPRAVGLARLLSASVDRWDEPAWPGHLALLTALAEQTRFAELILGSDLDGVAAAIAAGQRATAT